MSTTVNGSTGITFPDGTTQNTVSLPGMRNRIINGDFRIDQRNAGASVTPVSGQYLVDRFQAQLTQASKFTAQQNAGSVTPPVGFTSYLGITSSSAYSVISGDLFDINQRIEGFNVADLGWGTANAQAVTLSFWARSSLTGTFGGSLIATGGTRSYPFSYTIASANTWEQKTITIAGDTTGTWNTGNGIGIQVIWSLGAGSTYSGTANSWQSGNFIAPTGATSVVGTNGATFYITGVQLEKGSTATSFDYRPYGNELALCERYCYAHNGRAASAGVSWNSTTLYVGYQFPVTMRTAPSITVLSLPQFSAGGFSMNASSLSINGPTNQYCWLIAGVSGATSGQAVIMGSGGINFEAEL